MLHIPKKHARNAPAIKTARRSIANTRDTKDGLARKASCSVETFGRAATAYPWITNASGMNIVPSRNPGRFKPRHSARKPHAAPQYHERVRSVASAVAAVA